MYQYVIIRINYRLTQRAKQIKNLGLLPFFRLSPSFIQCSKPNNILHLNKQRECEDICTPEICCMQFDDRILGGECPLPSVTSPIYSHLEPWLLFPNHQACFWIQKSLGFLSRSNHCWKCQKSCSHSRINPKNFTHKKPPSVLIQYCYIQTENIKVCYLSKKKINNGTEGDVVGSRPI